MLEFATSMAEQGGSPIVPEGPQELTALEDRAGWEDNASATFNPINIVTFVDMT